MMKMRLHQPRNSRLARVSRTERLQKRKSRCQPPQKKLKQADLRNQKNKAGRGLGIRNLLTASDKTWAALSDGSSRARHFSCFPTLSRIVGRVSAPQGKLRKVHLTHVKSMFKPNLSNRVISGFSSSANEHRDVAQLMLGTMRASKPLPCAV